LSKILYHVTSRALPSGIDTAIVAMCVDGGMGAAALFEVV
jgi:hypothetical protein